MQGDSAGATKPTNGARITKSANGTAVKRSAPTLHPVAHKKIKLEKDNSRGATPAGDVIAMCTPPETPEGKAMNGGGHDTLDETPTKRRISPRQSVKPLDYKTLAGGSEDSDPSDEDSQPSDGEYVAGKEKAEDDFEEEAI